MTMMTMMMMTMMMMMMVMTMMTMMMMTMMMTMIFYCFGYFRSCSICFDDSIGLVLRNCICSLCSIRCPQFAVLSWLPSMRQSH